jgi:hypothetical protein
MTPTEGQSSHPKPPTMTELAHPTNLEATQRDVLYAAVAADDAPGQPTVAEARAIAADFSDRIPADKRTGVFYRALDRVEEYGYVEVRDDPHSRTDDLVVKQAAVDAVEKLAERSDAVVGETDA